MGRRIHVERSRDLFRPGAGVGLPRLATGRSSAWVSRRSKKATTKWARQRARQRWTALRWPATVARFGMSMGSSPQDLAQLATAWFLPGSLRGAGDRHLVYAVAPQELAYPTLHLTLNLVPYSSLVEV